MGNNRGRARGPQSMEDWFDLINAAFTDESEEATKADPIEAEFTSEGPASIADEGDLINSYVANFVPPPLRLEAATALKTLIDAAIRGRKE